MDCEFVCQKTHLEKSPVQQERDATKPSDFSRCSIPYERINIISMHELIVHIYQGALNFKSIIIIFLKAKLLSLHLELAQLLQLHLELAQLPNHAAASKVILPFLLTF